LVHARQAKNCKPPILSKQLAVKEHLGKSYTSKQNQIIIIIIKYIYKQRLLVVSNVC